tara:strand:- start:131 stop:388 length:258 start_codon:yes stop_codon:yes gene_type:complete
MNKHIVMTAAASMPASCWGQYKRVAVVELDPGFDAMPKMISTHAKGINKVVRVWENLNVGKTDRCAYGVALAEAGRFAARLNEGG